MFPGSPPTAGKASSWSQGLRCQRLHALPVRSKGRGDPERAGASAAGREEPGTEAGPEGTPHPVTVGARLDAASLPRPTERLAGPPSPRLNAWFPSGTGGQLPGCPSASLDHDAASGAPGISAGHAVAPGAAAGQPPRGCSQRRGPRRGPRNQQHSWSLCFLCFSDHGFAAFEFHGPADLTF